MRRVHTAPAVTSVRECLSADLPDRVLAVEVDITRRGEVYGLRGIKEYGRDVAGVLGEVEVAGYVGHDLEAVGYESVAVEALCIERTKYSAAATGTAGALKGWSGELDGSRETTIRLTRYISHLCGCG